MRISPVNFYNKKALSFGTTDRVVYKAQNGTTCAASYDYGYTNTPWQDLLRGEPEMNLLCSNHTCFFRKDMPWDTIGTTLDGLFPDKTKKVNVYNFACSDGSEPYSLAISLIEQLGEEGAKRFFPIKASDMDEELINIAKSRKILATSDDIEKINKMTKGNFNKYFEVKGKIRHASYLEPTQLLKDAVQFSKSDIEEGLSEVEPSNSLLLARNFWRYLPSDKLINVLQKMNKNLDRSSKIVIGDFDLDHFQAPKFFREFGFDSATKKWDLQFLLEKQGECPSKSDFKQTHTYEKLKRDYCVFARQWDVK